MTGAVLVGESDGCVVAGLVDGAALGGAGLALSQRENEDDPDSHRPLAFASARFSDAERGWPVRDQECYALFLALKEWRHWLLGARVIICINSEGTTETWNPRDTQRAAAQPFDAAT